MILVVSHEQDPHAERVLARLRAENRPTLLFNLAELPDRAAITIDYAIPENPQIEFVRGSANRFQLHEVSSVWWRRPQAPDLSSVTSADVQVFTANEWNEAIQGLWQLLRGASWMNDPGLDDAASRKARQLRTAAEVGLRVPRTMITSDPCRARRFVEEHLPRPLIYKTFSCTHAVWRETQVLRAQDLEHLEAVRMAPVIFQELVPAESDLRITAVGDKLFAAAIRLPQRGDRVDFRLRLGEASVQPIELPLAIRGKLLALLSRLGLVYGAIDMRRTPQGEYYFLEVNTAGEFLFIEDRTGMPIAQAIADWLSATNVPVAPSPATFVAQG